MDRQPDEFASTEGVTLLFQAAQQVLVAQTGCPFPKDGEIDQGWIGNLLKIALGLSPVAVGFPDGLDWIRW